MIAGLEAPDSGDVLIAGEAVDRAAAAGARRRLRLPALRRLQAHDRARQRRLRPEDPQAARRPRSASASTSCSALVQLDGLRRPLPVAALRRPAPAHGARPRAGRRAARAAARRAVRRARRPVRKELRDWLRRLHDEVHVTTIFVTHDQEEAMEVAEQIVVINDGRIEQAGSPRRPLRAARERVRHGLRRPGQPARRARGCARTTSSSLEDRGRRRASRRSSSASCASASRCASRPSLGDGAALVGPAHARRGRRSSSSRRASSCGCASHRCARVRGMIGPVRVSAKADYAVRAAIELAAARAAGRPGRSRPRRSPRAQDIPRQVPREHPRRPAPGGWSRAAAAPTAATCSPGRPPRSRSPTSSAPSTARWPASAASARRSWTTRAAPSRCATSGSPCAPACARARARVARRRRIRERAQPCHAADGGTGGLGAALES